MKLPLPFKSTIFCILFALYGLATAAQDVNAYYNTGVTLYGQQQYDLAITNFTKVINLNAMNTNAYIYRGLCYYGKRDYAVAMQDYNIAISIDPKNQIAYLNRGLAHYALKEYESSIPDFTKSISLNPAYISAYLNRGNAYYATAQYDLALQDYNKTIGATPNDPYAYTVRGMAYAAKKLNNLAITDYTKAISLNSTNADAFYYRGSAYFASQQYDVAILDFTKAISLNANYVNAYNARGTAYTYKGLYDLAIQDYNTAISMAPSDVYGYYSRGYANYVRKEFDLAIQDYTSAIAINPNYTDAYNNRGLAYKSKGMYASAVNDFVKVISLNDSYSRAYVNLVEPLARMYRFADAARYYNSFRSKNISEYIDADNYAFYKKYAEAIAQNLAVNDYPAALVSLQEAEKLYNSKDQKNDDYQKNNFSSILALKGYVLEQLNRNDEAKQAYDQALLINAVQPDVIAALQKLAQKRQVIVKADDTPPVITILEPVAKRSFTIEDDNTAGMQRIRGKAYDANGIKKITVNNNPVKMEEGGYFETSVNIKEGVNVFTVIAVDNNANSSSENVVIEGGKAGNKPQEPVKNKDIPAFENTSTYYAVLIAETDYTDPGIKSLPGTVSDMRKMYNVLVNNYNFNPSHTDTLVNATKVNILEGLIQKANTLKENDNLFVFYAGHGQMIKHEDDSEEGFLVPVDAGRNKMSSYISSDDLVRTIKYSKAKHILFVADACFAGSLFRDIASDAPEPVAEAYKDKSRKVLASGNRQAVPDQSEFIEYLRLALQENKEKYITAEQLIDSFKNQYKTTTHLQLQYYPIKNVDDLGGQFVFMRK
jgi:tetratricopeptide (TPR) repeat protein